MWKFSFRGQILKTRSRGHVTASKVGHAYIFANIAHRETKPKLKGSYY